MKTPGMLLTSTYNNYANRLFNVAITRTKGKFIGLVIVDYMNNKNLSQQLIFKKIIDSLMNDSNYITGKYFENRQKDCVKGIMNFYTQEDGNQEFLNNILKAKKEIRIDIPNKPVESSFCITLAKTLNTIRKKELSIPVIHK